MQLILLPQTAPLPTCPIEDIDRAANFARLDKAESTRAAYRSDFWDFLLLVRLQGRELTPSRAATLAAFLAHEAERGMAASTIGRRNAAIRFAHKLSELEPPSKPKALRQLSAGSGAPSASARGTASLRPLPKLCTDFEDHGFGRQGHSRPALLLLDSAELSGGPSSWL